jgi:hypothetical protein
MDSLDQPIPGDDVLPDPLEQRLEDMEAEIRRISAAFRSLSAAMRRRGLL